jgi:hypothetical protein
VDRLTSLDRTLVRSALGRYSGPRPVTSDEGSAAILGVPGWREKMWADTIFFLHSRENAL